MRQFIKQRLHDTFQVFSNHVADIVSWLKLKTRFLVDTENIQRSIWTLQHELAFLVARNMEASSVLAPSVVASPQPSEL